MGHRKKRRGKKHSQPDSKSKQAIGCQNPAHGQIDEQSKVLSSLTEQIGLFTIPEEDAFATIMTDTTSLLSDGDDDSSDSSWIFTDDASSSNSDVSYSDSICSISSRRSYKDVVANGGTRPPSGPEISCEQAQTRDVLEAVDIKGKSPLQEPDNWEIVAKKESRKEKLDYPSKQHYLPEDCYQKYRNTASQHWDAANAFYDKARIARASGKWEDAKNFSIQGRMCEEKARQADETASKDIFDSRNKGFENSMTIDLHGQHVKEGVKILKHHLVFGVYRRSLLQLRVITGYGSHGTGPSELKQSVVDLLQKENIEWKEENRGTLLIKFDGQKKELNFVNSGSYSD